MSAAIDRAIAGWRAALGEAAILTDAATLSAFQMNTSEFAPRDVMAVIVPESPDDVREVIAVARSTGIPVQPLSSGRNWGFGSALPAHPCALVDLRRINRIRAVNDSFRFAVIEPGVTQGQLSDHLIAQGHQLKVNVTGAGRNTSIVGNVLDNGGGNLGARVDDLLGLEVVLGNGDVVRTGLWHLERASDCVHHWPNGLGPDLRGIFIQSAVGIVTAMAIRLHPLAPFLEMTVEVADADLSTLVDILRRARDESLVNGYMRINDASDPNIRFFTAGRTPGWRAQISLLGPQMVRLAAADELERRLHALARRVDRFDTGTGDLDAIGDRERELLTARVSLANGVPSDRSLHAIVAGSGVLRGDHDPGSDLDQDRRIPGFLCVNVTLPFSGDAAVQCAHEVRSSAAAAGVSTSCLFGVIGPTALSGFFPFYFDRTRRADIMRAHSFKDNLLERLASVGIHPMRLDIDSVGPFMQQTADGFWRTVTAIKDALDPQGIIAGRYIPEPAREPQSTTAATDAAV